MRLLSQSDYGMMPHLVFSYFNVKDVIGSWDTLQIKLEGGRGLPVVSIEPGDGKSQHVQNPL